MVGMLHSSKEVNISFDEAIWFDAPESRTHEDNEKENNKCMRCFLASSFVILWPFIFFSYCVLDIVRYLQTVLLKNMDHLMHLLPHACMLFMVGFLVVSAYHLILLSLPNVRVGGLLCRSWILLLLFLGFLATILLFHIYAT